MALYFARSGRLIQSSGLLRNLKNGICHSKHSLGCSPIISTSAGLHLTAVTTHRENTVPSMRILSTAYTNSFHSSVSLLKKFKQAEYETLIILDPTGRFLCKAEMLVLEKFCRRYHRYTFHEFKTPEGDQSANAGDDEGLRKFQLVDKRKESSEEKEKKMKIIKFHRDAKAGEKMHKIFEALIEQGKVMVTFDKKDSPVKTEVTHTLKQFVKMNERQSLKGSSVVAFLNEIDSKLLLRLFEDIQKQEADHIASIKEIMNEVNVDSA